MKAIRAMEVQDFCFAPTDWQEYSDEHVLAIRALDSTAPSIFETVKITRNDDKTVTFRHEVIFVEDYLKEPAIPSLNRILQGCGYKDIDDFVKENATGDEWVYGENGNLDRENGFP